MDEKQHILVWCSLSITIPQFKELSHWKILKVDVINLITFNNETFTYVKCADFYNLSWSVFFLVIHLQGVFPAVL